MARSVIIYRNLVDVGDVGADHAVSTLPAAFLQESRISKKWRALVDTTAVFVDLGASTQIDYVGLIGTSLTSAGSLVVKFSQTDSAGSGEVYTSGALAVTDQYPDLHHLTTPAAARYVRIEMQESGEPMIEAGRLIVGLSFAPSRDFRYGWAKGQRAGVGMSFAKSGQLWTRGEYERRTLEIEYQGMTGAEMAANFDDMRLHAGRGKDLVVMTNTQSSNLPRDSMFGYMINDLRVTNPRYDRWRMPIAMEEHL